MPLHEKQLAFLERVMVSDNALHLSIGVRRSGKTHGAAAAELMLAHDYPAGAQFLLGARTMGNCQDGIAAAVQDMAKEWGMPCKAYSGAAKRLVVNGREFKLMGFADGVSHISLQGTTIGGAVLDEVQNLPQGAFEQILACASLRDNRDKPAKIIMTGNPLTTTHWVKQQLWDRAAQVGVDLYDWGREDNPSVSSDFYDRLGLQLTGANRARWYEGEWADEGGQVFPYWQAVTDADLPQAFGRSWIGVDYGDAGVTAAVKIAELPGGAGYVILDCYEWDNKSMRPLREVEQHVDAMIRQFGGGGIWYFDPSAPILQRELARRGLAPSGAVNDIKPGIMAVNALLNPNLSTGLPRLTLRLPQCARLQDRMHGLVWDEREKPTGDDHLTDALRYAAYPVWRQDTGLAYFFNV